MKSSVIQQAVNWIKSGTDRFPDPVHARPVICASDDQIDEAPKTSNMPRIDLFRPSHLAAPHRRRKALILATWCINVHRATEATLARNQGCGGEMWRSLHEYRPMPAMA